MYFFAIFMCIPQIKIFQKNGKRSTQEEADEVSQVRQKDNEENHQEHSGPERPLRIDHSPLKPVTYRGLVFALLCRFRAVLGPFLMFVYIKYIVCGSRDLAVLLYLYVYDKTS